VIASLGMYDRPETAAANDRFWGLIRDNLRATGIPAPECLMRKTPFWETWTAPDLLFSQTCGRPYRLGLHDKVQLIGTPDYGLPGCAPGLYHSVFVVRATDPRTDLAGFATGRLAYNEQMSQSGWAAPQCAAAKQGFQFENLLETGGHAASARAVADGAADIAALDGLTWQLISAYDDFARNLRVLCATDPTPGLPYITGPDFDPVVLFTAVSAAIIGLDPADKQTLRLRGLVVIPKARYLAVPNP